MDDDKLKMAMEWLRGIERDLKRWAVAHIHRDEQRFVDILLTAARNAQSADKELFFLRAQLRNEVGTNQWQRLRKLLVTPHEHYDGQNECPICDEPLVSASADEIEKLRAKLKTAEARGIERCIYALGRDADELEDSTSIGSYYQRETLRVAVDRLRAFLSAADSYDPDEELSAAKAFHPRAMKLIGKKKPFIVIAEDEPYFLRAYGLIRYHEWKKGTWSEVDEAWYQELRNRLENS